MNSAHMVYLPPKLFQIFSKHVREEVARNYLMSESILHSIQCDSPKKDDNKFYKCKHSATSSLIKHVSPELFRKYILECCPGTSEVPSESVELELPTHFLDCFDQQALENAAEAAIQWYVKLHVNLSSSE